MLPLSQGHLTLLDICPRKYQYVFFEALSGPTTYDQQLTTQWGSQFHRLMQQRALNLPVEVITEANADMAASMTALAEAAPEVFNYLSVAASATASMTQAAHDFAEEAPQRIAPFVQSEHRRTLEFNGYLLTVVYDLVVQSAERGQLFDWKTHQQPPAEGWLRDDWQTRLYLYVLCETTNLRPEQLEMTYWFVRLGEATQGQPSFYRFGYSARQHQRTRKDLQCLTDQLSQMRLRSDFPSNFPKVPIAKGLCDRCPFNVRCDRLPASTSGQSISGQNDPQRLLRAASQLTADMVQEIPL